MTVRSAVRRARVHRQPGPLGDRVLRVNHAGEHGAVAIYTGQLLVARWTAPGLMGELWEFRDHERGHRALFAAELAQRGRRRCRSYWLCGMGGFCLGAITAAFGANAIRATTVAVESVVLRHLGDQLDQLRGIDTAACEAIEAIIAEERMHHDVSAGDAGEETPWRRVLAPIVSGATETVIWLGMRL